MCVLGEVKTRANPYHNQNGCNRKARGEVAAESDGSEKEEEEVRYCHAEEDA